MFPDSKYKEELENKIHRKHQAEIDEKAAKTCQHTWKRYMERSEYQRTPEQEKRTLDTSKVPFKAYFTVMGCEICKEKRRIDYTLGI